MADWVGIKHALNSSLGTEYFRSLDQMISATMILEGVSGTKFNITNTTTGETFSVTLASGESKIIVPVPLGTYDINVIYEGKLTTVSNFNVEELGKPYKIPYYIKLASFTSNGTFIVPNGVTSILVDASGGGGGGGGGTNASGGAGGGGGASFIVKRKFTVSPGSSIAITVGAPGIGGVYRSSSTGNKGENGGATIIGNLITLTGGEGGFGNYGNSPGNGGNGSNNGARGGNGGQAVTNTSNGNNGDDSTSSKGGAGGIRSSDYAGGGGGGASYGDGGDGANGKQLSNGFKGRLGAGGGGAVWGNGGDGGAGFVTIYVGVVL